MRRAGVLFLACSLVVAICSPGTGVAEIARGAGEQNPSDVSVTAPGTIGAAIYRLKESGPRSLLLANPVRTLQLPRAGDTMREAAHAPSTRALDVSAPPLAARAPPLA